MAAKRSKRNPDPLPESWHDRRLGVASRNSETAHRGSIVAGSDCGAIAPLADDAVHASASFHTRRCVRCYGC